MNANLMRIASGRTMIIVSHRLSSLTECDQILVMDQGKVLDVAPHATLLERCALVSGSFGPSRTGISRPRSARPVVVPPRLV